jgi:predicted RNA polymerase sigma factor
MTTSDTQRAIEVVWRIESARIVAGLARIVRAVGLTEELARDALVAALEPRSTRRLPSSRHPRHGAESCGRLRDGLRSGGRG